MPSRARFTLNLPPNVLLAIVCLGVFLASLDQTSVVTALPAVMIDLGVSINRLDSLAWVVTAYLLGFTVAMPLLGRAGDIYGYRLLYFGALLLFAMGSVGVALAPNLSLAHRRPRGSGGRGRRAHTRSYRPGHRRLAVVAQAHRLRHRGGGG